MNLFANFLHFQAKYWKESEVGKNIHCSCFISIYFWKKGGANKCFVIILLNTLLVKYRAMWTQSNSGVNNCSGTELISTVIFFTVDDLLKDLFVYKFKKNHKALIFPSVTPEQWFWSRRISRSNNSIIMWGLISNNNCIVYSKIIENLVCRTYEINNEGDCNWYKVQDLKIDS